MFRISHYIREILQPTPLGIAKTPPGPVVIWNLIRRCNLTCKHCYSISADRDFPGELTTADVFDVMDDLKAFAVPVLILSGGEPLLRTDIFDISKRAKSLGFFVALSTNGTLISAKNIEKISAAGYDYVGISLDGVKGTHDRFRRKPGAFDASLHGIRLCRDHGLKVGIRFTLTQDNASDLPQLLDMMHSEDIDKFYLSHLNYAGRGNRNKKDDATFRVARTTLDLLFDTCWRDAVAGKNTEYVTGNNDADAVYLLQWTQKHHPEMSEHIRNKLRQWGGNSSGVNVANIDNMGDVHPDSFWWHYKIGNVRQRSFADIWQDTNDPVMSGLKKKPRVIKGRCSQCSYFDICGGNTRIRALQLAGDPWAEDPGCYLTDAEIGLDSSPKAISKHEEMLA